jgi:hypothetical protein
MHGGWGFAASRRFGAHLGVALALAACTGPGWVLDTNEPDAAIYLDGRLVGHGYAAVPYRFYGASSVAVMPARRAVNEDVRGPTRTLVHLDPPAPKWLFPADFFLEAVARGFAPAPPAQAEVAVPEPTTTLTAGTRPPRAADLVARAQLAQRER